MPPKFSINFGSSVIAIPGAAYEHLDRASASDVKVLWALCAHPETCATLDSEETVSALADAASCTEDEVRAAVAFWRGTGVIDMSDSRKKRRTTEKAVVVSDEKGNDTDAPEKSKSAATTPVKNEEEKQEPAVKKPLRRDELPKYTTVELTALLEERRDAADFINECQNVWGRIFNTHEVNVILGLSDYRGLDFEYILTLLAYCKKTQEEKGLRKSLHYVESTSFGLYDDGVCDIVSLHERLKQMDMMAQTEGKLRQLFGMGARALTPKEKKCFSTWLYEYKFDIDIIKLAYNVTVDAKGSPSIAYVNSVLANWNRDGLRTADAIEKAQEEFKAAKNKTGKKSGDSESGSFDTDDFFNAALRRSFGEDFKPEA